MRTNTVIVMYVLLQMLLQLEDKCCHEAVHLLTNCVLANKVFIICNKDYCCHCYVCIVANVLVN